MKTTLTLDDDVAAMLEREREFTGKPLKQIVNTALREGLQRLNPSALKRELFKTTVFQAGKCLLPNLDCIGEVLEELEGPWYK